MREFEHEAVEALPEVARLYLKHGQEALDEEDADAAVELFEKVLQVYPNLSYVNGLLGEAYLMQGSSGKAIRIFKKLVGQEPENAFFLGRLAHAYAMRGWHNKAVTYFSKALALDEGDLTLRLGLVQCLADAGDFDTARAADFFASLAQKIQKKGWYREAADLLAAACELLPDDLALRQTREEFHGQNRVDLLLDKLESDPVISDNLVETLRFEQETCGKKDCLDCGVSQFFFEMDVILELGAYRREIAHLKSHYPELYALKKNFFDSVLNQKKEQHLHETYHNKYRKYSRLCPERFDVDEDDGWEDPVPETFVRSEPKVGRNEPCPCGSGKKFKKCCGR